MSLYTVERTLWEICNVPGTADRFRDDPAAVLDGRSLDAGERQMIEALDVRALAAYDVNQMLVMMTWNILVGAEKIPEYLAQLNGAAPAGAA